MPPRVNLGLFTLDFFDITVKVIWEQIINNVYDHCKNQVQNIKVQFHEGIENIEKYGKYEENHYYQQY